MLSGALIAHAYITPRMQINCHCANVEVRQSEIARDGSCTHGGVASCCRDGYSLVQCSAVCPFARVVYGNTCARDVAARRDHLIDISQRDARASLHPSWRPSAGKHAKLIKKPSPPARDACSHTHTYTQLFARAPAGSRWWPSELGRAPPHGLGLAKNVCKILRARYTLVSLARARLAYHRQPATMCVSA